LTGLTTIVINELQNTWNQETVAYFRVFYSYLPGETEEICYKMGRLEYEARVTDAYKTVDRVYNWRSRLGIYYNLIFFKQHYILIFFVI
jgi:hypothetical protein